MRNSARLLLALVLGGLCHFSAIRAQTNDLDRFVGKDLWKGRLSKNDSQRLERIVGKVPKGQLMEPAPWHVWKTNRSGQTRYVVLFGEPLVTIPGGSSACVQLFDPAVKRIRGWCFQTGWRLNLGDASVEGSNDLSSELIVLHMAPVINGADVAKEYFALSNDRLRFVRIENDKGEAVQNEYIFHNAEIGVVPEATTVDEWASMLESNDSADVLSALTFLGGRHLAEPQRHFAPEPQESKYAVLFQQLLSDPRIRGLIDRLAKSENVWMRQAAVLAARGPRERFLQ